MSAYARLLARDPNRSKYDLSRIRALVEGLGHPERAYPTVLIAGTNGKGSVAAIVERALRASGRRTGRYTSPHLVHPEERIAIDGRPVDTVELEAAIRAVEAVESALINDGRLGETATFFEAMTAAAFELLRRKHVDVGVIEVGLGGQLDATNVCDPMATAIVSIDLDHQRELGSAVRDVATAKAGIAREGVPLVIGDLGDDALDVVASAAAAVRAPLVYAAEGTECVVTGAAGGRLTVTLQTPTRIYGPVRLALAGAHQAANAFVAVALLEAFDDAGLHVDRAAVEIGLAEARWPGRLDRVTLAGGRTALLDAAHNAAGARALAIALRAAATPGPEQAARPPLVFAAAKDKDVSAMIAALAPAVGDIVVTAFADPRAMPADELAMRVRAAIAAADDQRVRVAATPEAALAAAWALAPAIVVAGSIFLLGEIYPLLGRPDPFA